MPSKTFVRTLNGEHVIQEAGHSMAREQIVLAPVTAEVVSGTALGVVTATKQWKPWDPTASDGSQNCRGFLFIARKPNTNPQTAVAHTRDCIINGKKVVWNGVPGVTPTQAQITAAIANLLSIDIATARGTVLVEY